MHGEESESARAALDGEIAKLDAEIAKLKAELSKREAGKAEVERFGCELTACGLYEIKTLKSAIAEKEHARNKLA